ncbi:hypothetical protein GCM10027596_32140 [Nocardioides korecus]
MTGGPGALGGPGGPAGTLREPLRRVTSIKVKLGLLVVAAVVVAAVLATLGAGTVPAWLSIPVIVLLALGVTQLLAVGMTSPLRQMTEAVRRMASGDYAVRVETGSTDEVGELARAFNVMAADLGGVDRQRRDLVASVSHELRTPLTALVAVLENLADGVTAPDPRTVRTALGQAERLSDLVTDLLDLSRVDAGVVALERRVLPVRDLVDRTVAEAGPTAAARRITVEVEVRPADLTTYVDPRRLHQLLANLLDNAVRHGPTGSTVRVLAHPDPAGGTRLEVVDDGPGIAPVDRERVFERFGRLPHAGEGSTGATGGTGLGLAIARWVTDLHGGRIVLVDPAPGANGARFVVELPAAPGPAPLPAASDAAPPAVPAQPRTPQDHHDPHERTTPMPTTSTGPTGPTAPPTGPQGPGRTLPPPSLVDDAFGSLWREAGVPARRGVVLCAVGIGILAGAVLPYAAPGLGLTLVLLASGALVLTVSRHRREPFTWACAVLCAGFALVVTLRDAQWVAVLGLLVGALLTTTALVSGRSALGMFLGALAWPFAGLRGLPWLGRSLRAFGAGSGAAAVVRTVLLSLVAVLVFGLLFATGDAIVGHWVSLLLPHPGGSFLLRVFTAVAVGGVVLAAAYLALNPPLVSNGVTPRRPARHRFEWLAPVLLVDAVLVLFLAAQAAAFLGGHDYVRRATGLTYADYVHQGFAQLTTATALTLLVVWAASRRAGETDADRRWLRGSLGVLCVLTLVVVASALRRLGLYQDAYGFTRLRLLADLFEGWLGLVVVAVLVAGIRLRGAWLPRVALLTGAALLLGLALANPDAWIARHNLARFEATGKVDADYLAGLSADALPTILAHPLPLGERCLLGDLGPGVGPGAGADSWAAWNLGRSRARAAVERQASLAAMPAGCP